MIRAKVNCLHSGSVLSIPVYVVCLYVLCGFNTWYPVTHITTVCYVDHVRYDTFYKEFFFPSVRFKSCLLYLINFIECSTANELSIACITVSVREMQ